MKTAIPLMLLVEGNGTLWIGSSAGLTSYSHRTGRFKTYTAANGLSGNRVSCIKEDMRGNLWVGYMGGYVDRRNNGKFTAFNETHGLKKGINAIVENRKGNLLFATRENGVFEYRDGSFIRHHVPGLDKLQLYAMVEDWKGVLWIGTDNGLFRVTHKTTVRYTTNEGLPGNKIITVLEDSERNLWAGTLEGGLVRIKKAGDGHIVFERVPTTKSFKILCLFEDREKSLWICTLDSGIKRLKDGKFTSYTPLEAYHDEIFLSMFRDSKGNTWLGTYNGKLFRCQGSDLKEILEPPELSGSGITAIEEDKEGSLWIGTNGEGVFRKKKGTYVQYTIDDGLADNQVISIFKDSQGNLWFCTSGGISIKQARSGILDSFASRCGLSGKTVHNVYEDKAHNIWIATNRGITLLTKSFAKITHYLAGVSITCIYEDPDAPEEEGPLFWAATDGAGLKRLRLKDGKITHYTTDHGMATNVIYQFFEDRDKNFWLMSNSGVLRVGKGELNRFAHGQVGYLNCISFGIADGMKSSEFNNEFSRHSALKTKSGEFRFVTKKGISIVDPENISINKTPPPVVIEQVWFDRQSISSPSEPKIYTFTGIRNVKFRFTAPTFLSPEKIRFKYQIAGVDKIWIYLPAGKERIALYEDLEPGTHTFKVTACNAEGVWNTNATSFTFALKPFFYQTLFFKIAIFLALIGVILLTIYIYKIYISTKSSKDNTIKDIIAQFLSVPEKNLGLDTHVISRARYWFVRSYKTKKILDILSIPILHVEKTLHFMQNSNPNTRCEYFAHRLGANFRPIYESWGNAFRIYMNEDFMLRLSQCIVVFPPQEMPFREIVNQLKKIGGGNYKACLLITTDVNLLERLRTIAADTTNLFVCPDNQELINLLLTPKPSEAFARLVSSQIKLIHISPYQTVAGVNKESIFFGREKMLAYILHREPANYLLVGGRQIGKSSILKAIYRRYKDDLSTECHYLVLDGPEIIGKLSKSLGFSENTNITKLLSNMGNLKKIRRRLFLIDEADKFIAEEVRSGFTTLRQLRSLSEEGKCYFIMTGFWELYHAATFNYQSPLYNFGETLIVEALEHDACRQLATKPMAPLNIRYESDELIETLIHETGRRANLIALTCDNILTKLNMSERVIYFKNLDEALYSNAMNLYVSRWIRSTHDKESNRLDNIIVYATIERESFTLAELIGILETHNCRFGQEKITESLTRLEFSFILKKEQQSYSYRVPIFKKIILKLDPSFLLKNELMKSRQSLSGTEND
ncbi:MAG: hypothetical protein KAT34_18405 [Candidatus Aminicenantes bacterium]|nr:hypothetical protein [Candidatus Aminicenantes bacterium]